MRKLLTLFLTLPFFLISCGKSDDDSLDSALIGEWIFQKNDIELDVYPESSKEKIENYILKDMLVIFDLEFKTDNTVLMNSSDGKDYLVGWTDGDKLYLKYAKEKFFYWYHIQNDKLNLKMDMKELLLEEINNNIDFFNLPADFKINKAVVNLYFEAGK